MESEGETGREPLMDFTNEVKSLSSGFGSSPARVELAAANRDRVLELERL